MSTCGQKIEQQNDRSRERYIEGSGTRKIVKFCEITRFIVILFSSCESVDFSNLPKKK